MKVVKFAINEVYYQQFKSHCEENGLTIKKKLNVLLAQDTEPENIKSHFPEDAHEDVKRVTLKVNEELYKGVMKKCGKYELRTNQYIAYLIFKFLETL